MFSFIISLFSLALPTALATPATCTGLSGQELDRCIEQRLTALELRAAAPAAPAAPATTPTRASRTTLAPSNLETRWLICGVAEKEVCEGWWGENTAYYMAHIEARYRCSDFSHQINLQAALQGDPAHCPNKAPVRGTSSADLAVQTDPGQARGPLQLSLLGGAGVIAYGDPEGPGVMTIPTAGAGVGLMAFPSPKKWGWSLEGSGWVGGQMTAGGQITFAPLYGVGEEGRLALGPRAGYMHWEVGVLREGIVAHKGDAFIGQFSLRALPGGKNSHFLVGLDAGVIAGRLTRGGAGETVSAAGFAGGGLIGGVF